MPKQLKERTRGGGRYTEAAFWGFIRSGLRAKFNKWPPKWDVLAAAKRTYSGAKRGVKYEYVCANCGLAYTGKEVQVDHVIPCGSLTCFEDLVGFVDRLFVESDGLQVLCSCCHATKTESERLSRSAERGGNSGADSCVAEQTQLSAECISGTTTDGGGRPSAKQRRRSRKEDS